MGHVNGIESVIYGVEDLDLSTRYFIDFGLPLLHRTPTSTTFELEEGSSVVLAPLGDVVTQGQSLVGLGVQKTIWGVPDAKTFDRVLTRLGAATDLRVDEEGTAHFLDCDGIAMGLRIYNKKRVWGAPDPINSYSNVNRINIHRRWRIKANPKTIQHVVYQVPNPMNSFEWYKEHLEFRLSDIQEGFGVFARAPGTNDHHSLYWLKADLPFPGLDGKVRFNHVNYGVEDIDEAMVGSNYLERRGWAKSIWGLGRHRIASSIFLYLPCPAGGEAEYGTDSDVLDDNWVPRRWNARFGTMSFMHNLQPWILDEAPWDVGYVNGHVPDDKPGGRPPALQPSEMIIPAGAAEAAGALRAHVHTEKKPGEV